MTRLEQRKYWLSVREQTAVKLMRDNVPVSHIARSIGVEYDNTRKLVRSVAKQYGIDYCPRVAADPFNRLGDANRTVRRRLADALYMLRQWRHPLEITLATGIPQRHQRLACDPPYNHDWSWGEMASFACLLEATFDELTTVLDEDENTWQHWLNGRTVAQHRTKILSAA